MTPRDTFKKSWLGQEPSSRVLESGVSQQAAGQDRVEVLWVDVRTAQAIPIGVIEANSAFQVQAVPDGRHLALVNQIRSGETSYRAGEPPLRKRLHRISIVAADGARLGETLLWTLGAAGVIDPDDLTGLRWSRNGKQFAVLGAKQQSELSSAEITLYRGTLDGRIEPTPLPGLKPKRFVWAEHQQLLVLAEPERTNGKARADWWRIQPGKAPRNLSLYLKTVPVELIAADAKGRLFAGVAEGEVWRVAAGTGVWSNITIALKPKITKLVWSAQEQNAAGVALVNMEEKASIYRLDLATGAHREIATPLSNAPLADYEAQPNIALFYDNLAGELAVCREEKCSILLESSNRRVLPNETRSLSYRSLDGQPLTGSIMLPTDYRPGRLYPTLVWVYPKAPPPKPGLTISKTMECLLAARGYAILYPSMRLPKYIQQGGAAMDIYLELMKGVMPAVDEAIEEGLTDLDRLAVEGYSFGGYSTFGLMTQTTRFKAAIAGAGISDFQSWYGTFSQAERYGWGLPSTNILRVEGAQASMGSPPWKDVGRYLRNSPINYVERIQTPVLIVHGESDQNIPISESERMFSALLREKKRARYITYYGEGHAINGPVNVRDLYFQTIAWLDEHLDIARDSSGRMLWEGERVRSRRGAPPLKLEDYAAFEISSAGYRPWPLQPKSASRPQNAALLRSRQ